MRIVRSEEMNNNNKSTCSSLEDSWSCFGEDVDEEEEEKSDDEALGLSNGHAFGKPSFEEINVRIKEVLADMGAENSEQEEAEGKLADKENFSISLEKEIEKVKVLVPLRDGGKGMIICSRDNGEKVDLMDSEGTRLLCSFGIGEATSEGKKRPARKGKNKEKRKKTQKYIRLIWA